MSMEHNNLLIETLLETRVSQPLHRSEKTDESDTFSKTQIPKKRTLVPLPFQGELIQPQTYPNDDPDKLTLNPYIRRDTNGVPIKKRQKAHKIKLKDDFVEVVMVENWKKYNLLEEKAEEKVSCHCNCLLI